MFDVVWSSLLGSDISSFDFCGIPLENVFISSLKYYCLLIQFLFAEEKLPDQTARIFNACWHFLLCRSQAQKLAASQIMCQYGCCYFIFIKIAVQTQKTVPRFYPIEYTPCFY